MSHRTAPQGTATVTVWTMAALTLGALAGLAIVWHVITDDWATTVHTLIGSTLVAAAAAVGLFTATQGRRLYRAYRGQS